jgi:hypothetical protein
MVARSSPDEVDFFFSIYLILLAALWREGRLSLFNRNECQESSWRVKGGRHVGLTTSPSSVSRLYSKMWEPRPLTTVWAFTACYKESFIFTFFVLCPSSDILETRKHSISETGPVSVPTRPVIEVSSF